MLFLARSLSCIWMQHKDEVLGAVAATMQPGGKHQKKPWSPGNIRLPSAFLRNGSPYLV